MQNWNPWRAVNIDEPPLAFMSMTDISAKLADLEMGKTGLEEMNLKRDNLPVSAHRQRIIDTVRQYPVTLIKGETGCGKSTQVRKYSCLGKKEQECVSNFSKLFGDVV